MSLFDIPLRTLRGEPTTLADHRGKALLLVNVASKCGQTPQYAGLEQLHEQLAPRGFSVLGFPSNQFGAQDPGSDDEIAVFCQRNYGVSFPMFSKIEVNGDNAHPLYKWLRGEKGGVLGDKIKWNFTKFLIGRDGQVIARYAPTTEPGKLASDIEKALGQVS